MARHLDDAGANPGIADAALDLMDEMLGDVGGGVLAHGLGKLDLRPPIGRISEDFAEQAGGHDDLHPGPRRHLGGQANVAAKIAWTRIDDGGNAEAFQFGQPIDANGQHFTVIGTGMGRIDFPSGQADCQMLVHHRLAQAVQSDGPGRRIDAGHHYLLFKRVRRDDRRRRPAPPRR